MNASAGKQETNLSNPNTDVKTQGRTWEHKQQRKQMDHQRLETKGQVLMQGS